MEEIRLKPIGVVHRHTASGVASMNRDEAEGVVEVYGTFEDALDGIDGFSHIFVLAYFHQLRPEQVGPLKVKPRGLLRYGLSLEELPTVGVFAVDSPTRPNPIGLTLVRLIRREGRNLLVRGLDYFDGTPVLDIKPYQQQYRVEDYTLPKWYTQLREKTGRV